MRLPKLSKLLGKKTATKIADVDKTAKLSDSAKLAADAPVSPEELQRLQQAALDADKSLQLRAWLAMNKKPQDIIRQAKDAALAPERAKLDEIRRTRDFSGFENWAEGGPTTQALREQAKKEFELGKTEGAKDIDLQAYWESLSPAKKAAALAAGSTAGLALDSEEAEAGIRGSAAKKAALELFHATRGAFEGDKLKAGSDKLIHFGSKEQAASRFDELLKQNKVSSGAQTIPVLADIKNPVELSDLNDWSANKIFRDMKKRGIINEQQAQEIVDKSRATGKQWGNDIDKDTLFDYMQNKLGYDAIKYKNIFEASEADKILAASKINPEMAKIPDLRAQKASLEAQLLDEAGNIKPSSRETDKIHDQINKLDKQLRPLQNKLQSTFEQGAEYSYAVPEKHGGILKSKFSGTPLAIGGTAIGAGGLVSSPSAQAAIDGSISQSNPEFSGKQRIAEESETPYRAPAWLKSPEEVGKSAFEGGMSALEAADKYTGRPARAGLLAALQERNPLTAAKEAITEDKDVEGKEIARELFKKFEQSGMPLRAPGQEEYPLENILGTGIDFTADPTNLIGTGIAAKGAKFAKTLGRFK